MALGNISSVQYGALASGTPTGQHRYSTLTLSQEVLLDKLF